MWQAGAPWWECALPYARKSFHNFSASFLLDVASEASGHLLRTLKGQRPSTSETPYLPLLYSFTPLFCHLSFYVESESEMRKFKPNRGGQPTGAGSQGVYSPSTFDFDALKGIHGCVAPSCSCRS